MRRGGFERRGEARVPADDARGRRQRHDLHVRRRHHQLVGIALVEHFAGAQRADDDAPGRVRHDRRREDGFEIAAELFGRRDGSFQSRASARAALRSRDRRRLDGMSWHRARGGEQCQRRAQRDSGGGLFQLLEGLGDRVDGAGVDLRRARFAGARGEAVGAGLGQRDLVFLLAFVELDGRPTAPACSGPWRPRRRRSRSRGCRSARRAAYRTPADRARAPAASAAATSLRPGLPCS